jgi:hypothetical protein
MDEHKLKETTPPEIVLILRQLQIEMAASKQKASTAGEASGKIFTKFSMWDAEFNEFMVELSPYYVDSQHALKTLQEYIYNQGIVDFFLIHSNALYQKYCKQAGWGDLPHWEMVQLEGMQNIRPYCFQKFYTNHINHYIKPEHHIAAQKKYHEFLNKVGSAHEAFDWLQMQVVNMLHALRNVGEDPKNTAQFCREAYEKVIHFCEVMLAELVKYGEPMSGEWVKYETDANNNNNEPDGNKGKIVFKAAARHIIDISFVDVQGTQRNHPFPIDIPVIAIEMMQKLIIDFTAHTKTVKELEAHLATKGQIIDHKNRHSFDLLPYKPSRPSH